MPPLNVTVFNKKLRELRVREKELREQLSMTKGELEAVQGQLAAYMMVAEECSRPAGGGSLDMPVEALRGMTLPQALTAVACHVGLSGEINAFHLRPFLIEAGILRGTTRSTSSRLHEGLTQSEHFEHAEKRGRWRVCYVEPPQHPLPPPPHTIILPALLDADHDIEIEPADADAGYGDVVLSKEDY